MDNEHSSSDRTTSLSGDEESYDKQPKIDFEYDFNNDDDIDDVVKPDDVLQQLGGCGMFQFLLSLFIQSMKLVVAWGMGGNAFFAYVPKWRCVENTILTTNNASNVIAYDHVTTTTTLSDVSKSSADYWNQNCSLPSGETCTKFEFDDSIHTLVDEFGLVCGKSWVTASIISIQMIGMMVGSVAVGPLSDIFGRKKPLVLSMGLLGIFHFVCYFSPTWAVFAAGRFFIGIGSAFFLTTYCVAQGEFTLSKWRSTVISFPSWAMEMCLFTLFAWLLHNWEHITLLIAIGSFAFLGTWIFIPESFRWLMARDRTKEAKALMSRIAKWNKRDPPDFDKYVAKAFSDDHDGSKKYSVIVLFRNRTLLKLTLPLITAWLALGVIGYGIGFGIKKLSGNFYLNMFIYSVIPLPSKCLTIYLQNVIGRRYTSMLSYGVCMVSGFLVGVMQYIDTPHRGIITNVFAFMAIAGVDAAWGPMQTLTVELYPTVARTTGFGFLSVMSRFGAVLGPQVVFLEDFVPGLLYFVVGGLAALSVLCILCLPETMNTTLVDEINNELEHTRRLEHREASSPLLEHHINLEEKHGI